MNMESYGSLLVLISVLSYVKSTDSEAIPLPKWTEQSKQLFKLAANATLQRAFHDYVNKYGTGKLMLHHDFPCTPMPNVEPATSVHQLTPSDVNVVAALGDSLTAGTGVKALTIIGLLTEWRGLAWSAGGDDNAEEAPTLPNFIKKYNPNVKGYSVKKGGQNSKNAHLNVADPGAKAKEMPGQAQMLVDRLQREPGVDFQNDWKIITLFVGANDLCDYCQDRDQYSVANYLNHIQTALDTLHAAVPRAFVNLVQVLSVPIVEQLNEGLICSSLHLFMCQCGAFPSGDTARQEIIDAGIAYRQALTDLVLSGRYDSKDDFTVVLQPFMINTQPPPDPNDPGQPDLSYFAPDCFHFSEKSQAAAAEALWNNMIEPVGQKRTSWTPGELIGCPDAETPYFYTYKNSPTLSGKKAPARSSFHSPDKSKSPDEGSKPSGVSTGAVIVGCLLALTTVAVGLGVALRVRKRRLTRNVGETGILLHSVNTVIYT